jgi:hypothetical protein
MTQPPIILCDPVRPRRADGIETWRFWCPHCRAPHVHGAMEGHRVAHCTRPSPFKETGYILKLRGNGPT